MYNRKQTVWLKGHGETELYTISYVASALGRSVETLRAWERQKVIPKAMYRGKTGVRLYHSKEIEIMKTVLKKYGLYGRKDQLRKEMYEALAVVRRELLEAPSEV